MGFLLLLLILAIVFPLFLRKSEDSGVTLSLTIPEAPQVRGLQAIRPVTDREREQVLESVVSDRAWFGEGGAGNTADADRWDGLQSWAVRVHSTSDTAEAASMVARLQAAGFRSFQREQRNALGPPVQVFVGPELQRDDARMALQRLADELGIEGVLVPVDRQFDSSQ